MMLDFFLYLLFSNSFTSRLAAVARLPDGYSKLEELVKPESLLLPRIIFKLLLASLE